MDPALIDEQASRLAAELVLARPGSDDGLIPSYSLLGELIDRPDMPLEVAERAGRVRRRLEALLDAARPFDEDTLRELGALVEWLAGGAKPSAGPTPAGGPGAPVPAATAAPPSPSGQDGGALREPGVPPDGLMDLQLEQNRELLAEFHAEAVDHLQQIEAALLELERNPGDAEAISAIFRAFHTIKGVSGFLQLVPMHTLTHEVESLLDLVRNGRRTLDSEVVTEILRSRDALQTLVGQVGRALANGELPSEIVPVAHLIAGLKRLARGELKVPAVPAPGATAAPETLAPIESLRPVCGGQAAGPTRTTGATTVRVNTEKLDSLMDVVGELVIVQSQLQESAREVASRVPALQRNLAQFQRITKELQHNSMALRMIPIKPTFQKMERLARDLSRACGKQVQFVTEGEDTELDRTVVEEIGDPLVHMVRNSLDHGIEPAEERAARGKPPVGRVLLKAFHRGSNIVLELRDDGRGLDVDRILAKARKQGLVPPDVVPPREEIFQLIFLPGFSTAEKVTQISGRGVGMDVVRRNIERLRGRIEIESEPGQGSCFRIVLPLTMAIIDGLVVRVGSDRFILPTTSVKMAYRPDRAALTQVAGRGEVLQLRGRVLPLHRLHRRFAIDGAVEDPAEGIVVIVESGGRTSGLLVDEMVSKQEVVIKSLGSLLQGRPGVAGGAILGDGSIALILDPASLLQAA